MIRELKFPCNLKALLYAPLDSTTLLNAAEIIRLGKKVEQSDITAEEADRKATDAKTIAVGVQKVAAESKTIADGAQKNAAETKIIVDEAQKKAEQANLVAAFTLEKVTKLEDDLRLAVGKFNTLFQTNQ